MSSSTTLMNDGGDTVVDASSSQPSQTLKTTITTTTTLPPNKPLRKLPPPSSSIKANQIPDSLLNDPILAHRIATALPKNYNFEVHKTIWRIERLKARRVCLQFPDGLFIFAIPLVNILREYFIDKNAVEFVIMADVVYGACCVDDCKAKELDCDLLIHYGHSCLVPIQQMAPGVAIHYVFVDIKFDLLNLLQSIREHFTPQQHRLVLAGTIQFVASIHVAARELRTKYGFEVQVPQSRPLTGGEILGCTAPKVVVEGKISDDNDDDDDDTKTTPQTIILFIADGRFHLEALMIANPTLPSYRYNPYNKTITREHYDHAKMITQRTAAVEKMVTILYANKPIGIIFGTLGRQGNCKVLQTLENLIKSVSQSTITVFGIAEINPTLLTQLGGDGDTSIYGWIQIGCPRLSIDWGDAFVEQPLLSPYELRTAIRTIQQQQTAAIYNNFITDHHYHMDFYAAKSLGSWTPSHRCHDQCECVKE